MSDEGSQTIRNCYFQYRCHMEWDDLDATSLKTVRHCGICNKNVYYCATQESLENAILANHCVAIPIEVVKRHGYKAISPYADQDNSSTLVGMLEGFDRKGRR